MLDFKEFQATRRKIKEGLPDWDISTPVYIYEGKTHIAINQGADIDNYGRYMLTISNWSECSDNLHELEEKLYEFYKEEIA